MASAPRVTVAVPSYNHGRYLDKALESIFAQDIALEVFVTDGGSSDESLEVIRRWEGKLAGWRSHPDNGQAAAINEGIAKGSAPYVCWINSDDWLLPGALQRLVKALERHPEAPMAYGRAWNFVERTGRMKPVFVRPFTERWMAQLCIVSQPATLIRRSAWASVGGVDEKLHMAMDYDLWWRIYRTFGTPAFVDEFMAVNREHAETKTSSKRREHYREAIDVVRRHYGRVPLKWWLAQPYAVWYRSLIGR
jgi:glycosyltransferase involved in cell wall biosynthesis